MNVGIICYIGLKRDFGFGFMWKTNIKQKLVNSMQTGFDFDVRLRSHIRIKHEYERMKFDMQTLHGINLKIRLK